MSVIHHGEDKTLVCVAQGLSVHYKYSTCDCLRMAEVSRTMLRTGFECHHSFLSSFSSRSSSHFHKALRIGGGGETGRAGRGYNLSWKRNKLLVAATAIMFSVGCQAVCRIFLLKSKQSTEISSFFLFPPVQT